MAGKTPTRRRPAGKRRKTKKRNTGMAAWLRRHALVLSLAVAGVVVGIGAIIFFGLIGYRGEPQWIFIPKYATETQITDSLTAKLGPGMAQRVMRLWRLQRGNPSVAHGAYLVDDGISALSISRNLAKGRQTPVRISFAGTRTLDRMYRSVTEPLEISETDFRHACLKELPELGYTKEEQFPAAFLPDTYEVYWSTDGVSLVKKLAGYTERFWTDERRKQAESLGLDPIGVATIASIVEEETAKRDERPKVARLYINRLKRGMKLQADPTVKYATGDFSIRRISHDHLKTLSPYNTYIVSGLPPGPIRIPEKATLIDVLEAPEHDYIYMCAREDFSGYHNFARDYATHQANAARYQAELNRRGIH